MLEGQALERLDDLEGARSSYLKALREANAPAVREQAVRGMISVLGKIGAHAGRLEYIDALIEDLAKMAPLERIGQPEDIAGTVAFLAGADGAWVNAQVIRANGGFA